MIDVGALTDDDFDRLPLVVEGESKVVRSVAPDLVAIKLKPTIYSFTHNRAGIVEGSDKLRLRATKVLIQALQRAGVRHAYKHVGEKFILSERILAPPPIEVIVKSMHSGTSKHRYVGMSGSNVRSSHPLYSYMSIQPDGPYPAPIVRFDWRNPLRSADGKWLADEVMCDDQADLYIDTKSAKQTALKTFQALQNVLDDIDIVLYDLCLFVSGNGKTVFGEISQDCGRFRHFDHGSLDKDVWRSGGSSDDIMVKWGLLADLLEAWEARQ